MKIAILTTGSQGDLQPYLALAIAINQAGHETQIAAFENYESYVRQYGLNYFRIRGDVTQAARGSTGQSAIQTDNPLKLIMSFSRLKTLVYDLQADFFAACQNADAVIYHPGALIGYFAAQQLGIPGFVGTPFPMSPTRAYPSLAFYSLPRVSGATNLMTHRILEEVMWRTSREPISQFWRHAFKRLPKDFSSPFLKKGADRHATLISCSQYVFPRPADWQADVHMRGYWFLDEPEEWQPPSALKEFLAAGPSPVYVGFGSIADPTAAAHLSKMVVEALRESGQRGVIATGWGGMTQQEEQAEDVYFLEKAPHAWLFPRMAAVVHHGGAGTTAAGLRAGVPTVIIPFGMDQFAWGRRVAELGVGVKPIPRSQLTSERLAAAIRQTLASDIRSAAMDIGVKIRSENGAVETAQILVDALSS